MAEQTLRVNLELHSDGTATIKGLGKDFEQFGVKGQASAKKVATGMSTLKTVALGVTVALGALAVKGIGAVIRGVGSLVRISKEWIGLANVQEDAIKSMESALQSQGKLTEALSKKYQNMASEIQAATTIGDEAILDMMGPLTRLGNVSEQNMKAATMATLDFATSMKVDAKTAAITVGKALSGNVQMLQRYGVAVRKGASETEILTLLTKKFGGASEAMAQTTGGAMIQISNLIGDIKEKLGTLARAGFEPLLPIIKTLAERTDAWIQTNLDTWIDKVRSGILLLIDAVTFLGQAFMAFVMPQIHAVVGGLQLMLARIKSFQAIRAEMSAMFSPMQREALSAVAPGAGLLFMGGSQVDLLKKQAEYESAANDLGVSAMQSLGKAINSGDGLAAFSTAMAEFREKVASAFANAGSVAGKAFTGGGGAVGDAGGGLAKKIEESFDVYDEMLSSKGERWLSDARNIANEIGGDFASYLGDGFVDEWVDEELSKIEGATVKAAYTAQDAWLDVGRTVVDMFTQWSQGAIGFGKVIEGVFGGLAGSLSTLFSGKLSELFKAGKKDGGGIFGGIKNIFKGEGGIGSLIGFGAATFAPAILGGLKKLFGGKPAWKKTGERLGMDLSEGLLKSITDEGFIKHFSAALAESDVSTVAGLESFTSKAMSEFAKGAATADDYKASLSELIPKFVELNQVGTAAWTNMLNQAKAAGTDIKEILRDTVLPIMHEGVDAFAEYLDTFDNVGPKRLERFKMATEAMVAGMLANGDSIVEIATRMGTALDKLSGWGAEGGIIGDLLGVRAATQAKPQLFQRAGLLAKMASAFGKSGLLRATPGLMGGMGTEAMGAFRGMKGAFMGEGMDTQTATAYALSQIEPFLREAKKMAEQGIALSGDTKRLVSMADRMGMLEGSGNEVVDALGLQTDRLEYAIIHGAPMEIASHIDRAQRAQNATMVDKRQLMEQRIVLELHGDVEVPGQQIETKVQDGVDKRRIKIPFKAMANVV